MNYAVFEKTVEGSRMALLYVGLLEHIHCFVGTFLVGGDTYICKSGVWTVVKMGVTVTHRVMTWICEVPSFLG